MQMHVVENFPRTMDPDDYASLVKATSHLEHPSLAMRLSSIIGTQIDIAVKLLPRSMYKRIRSTTETALSKSLKAAISSLRHDEYEKSSDHTYKMMVAGSGAVGGLFGLYALPFELGISTTIMLRSIAEIARAEGEDIHDPETQLACLEVFALGGETEMDDAAESGYYGIRMALSWPVTHAAHFIARNGLTAEGPMIVSLLSMISERFGVAMTQKMAAVAVPVIGAASAATINVVFMDHFQEMARGHFVIRRLERKYGKEYIKAQYEKCVNS